MYNADMDQSIGMLQERGAALAQRWSSISGKEIKGFDRNKHVNFMEGIEDEWHQGLVAMLLENCLQHYNRMDETTRALSVGNYEKYVFPIIRMTFANLVANDLVSVQPLAGPTGLIFYFDAIAGTTKGAITKGTKLFDAKSGPENSYHYSDELVENEAYGTGDGGTSQFDATLSYAPIRPGTFILSDGTQEITDDGNGVLIGDVGGGNLTINYATGAVQADFAANVGNGTAITATYEYDSEANDTVPEMEIQLTSSPVVARTNKLRARWSMEAEQDLLSVHGMAAETELVTVMTNQISKEINQKIVRHLRSIAPNAASPVQFDVTPPTGVSYRDHKEILMDAFTETANTIFSNTQRVQANWLVVAVNVANIVETLTPHFVKTPSAPGVTGIRKIGTLGEWDVYKDPSYPTNEWMMGYKGASFLDTGYVHAVYQGLVSTPTIVLDDFIGRKGMLSRTAQKVVNNRFYARGELRYSGNNPVSGP